MGILDKNSIAFECGAWAEKSHGVTGKGWSQRISKNPQNVNGSTVSLRPQKPLYESLGKPTG